MSKQTTKLPQRLIDFLVQIVEDGDWQYGDGDSMTTDAQKLLESIGVTVEAGVNPSELVDINYEPVFVELRASYNDNEPISDKPATLLFSCGRIKFSIDTSAGELMRLLRGDRTVIATAHFATVPILYVKNLKPMDGGRQVVLDVDTLEMPTLDENGYWVSAEDRLKK